MAKNTVLEHGGRASFLTQRRRMCLGAEKKTDRVVHTRLAQDTRNAEPLGPESDRFSIEGLVSSLKAGEAEGPDGLAPLFLKNLGEVSRSFRLDTFNKSWREGVCPQAWKDTVIVPILKPGKPEGQIDFYRPRALTSCLAKLMERIIGKRLQHLAEIMWHVES
jgi:hypothetical protein